MPVISQTIRFCPLNLSIPDFEKRMSLPYSSGLRFLCPQVFYEFFGAHSVTRSHNVLKKWVFAREK